MAGNGPNFCKIPIRGEGLGRVSLHWRGLRSILLNNVVPVALSCDFVELQGTPILPSTRREALGSSRSRQKVASRNVAEAVFFAVPHRELKAAVKREEYLNDIDYFEVDTIVADRVVVVVARRKINSESRTWREDR